MLLLLAACGPAMFTGCTLMGNLAFWKPPAPQPFPKPPVNFDKQEIVAHLNENIRRLRGWRSNDVRITAKQPGSIPIKLSSSIAVERDRNFRLRARSILRGDETDFGSNDERFWFWMRESPQKFVFTARHENVHHVQARMHIPFDPDWLIESLGVVEIDPSRVTLERTDPTGVVVDLFEERIIANGQRTRLATTVDTRNGLIVGRTLYDPAGGLVARATILDHAVHDADRVAGGIVVPHEIRLEWPKVDTTLVLDIGKVEINPVFSEDSEMFAMPTIDGTAVHEIDRDIVLRQPPRGTAGPRTAESFDPGFTAPVGGPPPDFEWDAPPKRTADLPMDEIDPSEFDERFAPAFDESPPRRRTIFDDAGEFGAPNPDEGAAVRGEFDPRDFEPEARSGGSTRIEDEEIDPSEFDPEDFDEPIRIRSRPALGAEPW